LLRRTLPKGPDLSVHSQADRHTIALRHNARPRKSQGCKLLVEPFLPPGSCDVLAHRATTINPVALGA
jgi:hypothetical protein